MSPHQRQDAAAPVGRKRSAARLRRTGTETMAGCAHNRLEHLYEISKLLADFEGLEPTVSAALAIAIRTLPIRSAILIEKTEDARRMVTWQADGDSVAMLANAKAHAQNTYAYLVGGAADQSLTLDDQPAAHAALSGQGGLRPLAKQQRRFIAIPLVVGRHPLFGALQFESAVRLQKSDLSFVNAITNQLAIALDRHHSWQRDIALREQAERATVMRDRILGVVSHDLRNPLGAILTTADALERLRLPDDLRDRHHTAVARIQRAAERMQRLIADLLDQASIQAGRLALDRRPCEPSSLVDEALVTFESLARDKGLQLRNETQREVPQMYADDDRILQVLSNLISNAVKVTPCGGLITLAVEGRGREAVFSVRDTGPGIPADELPQLFERYWRSPDAGYKGNGLGLAIARGIVEAHGGRIWVESPSGRGAALFFTVPVVGAEA